MGSREEGVENSRRRRANEPSGCRVQGLVCRVQGPGFRVQCEGFGGQGLLVSPVHEVCNATRVKVVHARPAPRDHCADERGVLLPDTLRAVISTMRRAARPSGRCRGWLFGNKTGQWSKTPISPVHLAKVANPTTCAREDSSWISLSAQLAWPAVKLRTCGARDTRSARVLHCPSMLVTREGSPFPSRSATPLSSRPSPEILPRVTRCASLPA